jgi:integrase
VDQNTPKPQEIPPELLDEFRAFLAERDQKQRRKRPTRKSASGGYYQDRIILPIKGLCIFRNSQVQSKNWYMRMYLGNKKYKTLCLQTTDTSLAQERAIEEWRKIQNQIDAGGAITQRDIKKCIDDYIRKIEEEVETGKTKRHTLLGKKSTLKKLREYLIDFKYPKDIAPNHFQGYLKWRRTQGWDKYHHKNPKPPGDATINKELSDFNRFWKDYLIPKGYYKQDIKFPFIKIKRGYYDDKNIPFTEEDWVKLVYYLRTWTRCVNQPRKATVYRYVFGEFLKILANSGMRPHEALLLRWGDITLKERDVTHWHKGAEDGEKHPETRKELIVEIQISPETKTGKRLVISPAGIYFRRIRDHYRKNGFTCKRDEFIFRNIGTKNQHKEQYTGKALSLANLRRLWYELVDELNLENHYTIYSCRSFYINQKLELGIPPHIVAKNVGHTVETMEKHYENIGIRKLTDLLVNQKRKKLGDADFLTFDMELDT